METATAVQGCESIVLTRKTFGATERKPLGTREYEMICPAHDLPATKIVSHVGIVVEVIQLGRVCTRDPGHTGGHQLGDEEVISTNWQTNVVRNEITWAHSH